MDNINNVIRVAQIMGKLNAGGVEAVIYNYYRHIDHTKIQFDFIIDEDSKIGVPQDILDSGARCFTVPPYQKVFKYVSALKKLFKENEYDIVHSNMTTLSVFSLYAAKKAKVPVRICHSHSTAGKGETVRNILKFFLKPYSRRFATHYFACSEYAGKWLFGKKAFKNGKVKVINNAIEVDKFKFDFKVREQLRKELNLENNFVIGHVGRFVTQKNQSFLIDVFNELLIKMPQAKLLLLGQGPLYNEINEKVKNLGISEKVVFAGIQPYTEKFYQAMDCFVLPSLYEGLPVVAVEAQAAGLPVVASDAMTVETKLVDDFKFLSLDAGIGEWCEQIESFSNGNSRTVSDGEFEKYDILTQAKKLEEFYLTAENK